MTLIGLLVVKITSVPRFYDDWFVIVKSTSSNLTLGAPTPSWFVLVKMAG